MMMAVADRVAVAALCVGSAIGALAAWLWLEGSSRRSAYRRFRSWQGAEKAGEEGHAQFHHERIPAAEALRRAEDFYNFVNQRRSVRFFSRDPVDVRIVDNCILAAGTAPSGAHLQPWRFLVVVDEEKRRRIREVVEAEEQENYDRRMGKAWVEDVHGLVSALHSEKDGVAKPYLTDAPLLIVVMKMPTSTRADGTKQINYYAEQSTGIASGLLITALHNANLVTLTSTPLNAESKIRIILDRPDNEKVFLLLPVGYPADDATVPMRDAATLRKPFDEICLHL